MNTFSAEEFYKLGQILKYAVDDLGSMNDGAAIPELVEAYQSRLGQALDLAGQIQLKITAKWIAQALDVIKDGVLLSEIRRHIWGIMETVEKEMDGRLFLYVPDTRSEFYHGGANEILTKDTLKAFNLLDRDARESGNAYACGLYTACVFHLMRVMELGLRATAKSLCITLGDNPNWSGVLKKFEREEIQKNPAANNHWMANQEFYQSVRSTLCAVKDAWRNTTMHIDRHYDETEAEEVVIAVRGFMRHLSTHVNQEGVWT